MKTIAIDFDGVIHKYSKGWDDGTAYDKPVEGSLEAILKLLREYSVFVFTTRDVYQVQDWFGQQLHKGFGTQIIEDNKFWDTPSVLGISNRKLPAIAYIDDRGIRFTNWTDVLNYF